MQKVKLTGKEKSNLFFEAVITIGLLALLNYAVLIIVKSAIKTNDGLNDGIFAIKRALTFSGNIHIWSWQGIFIIFMVIVDIAVLVWRLMRRYHQIQTRHVISELHYIANGHFDHRINFSVNSQLQSMITNINSLVDSTVSSMNEERRIEQSKDELITNVSHDIRTPLTSIIGYLGLLRNHQYSSQEEVDKYVDIAYLKSRQMKSLADDLFEYTTVRQTTTALNVTSLKVSSLLDQLAASFELEAMKKGITINVLAQPNDMMMEADAEKLGRVFNNLISNALKYGEKATFINLIAEKIDDKQIEFRVENNGEKIPDNALGMLFERFYRVESSRSVETGGAGLGLAISESIVRLHGGYMRVESDDKLTSFIIRFPVKSGEKLVEE